MRDIIFRGKRVDNGEWVYGYYCFYPHRTGYCTQTVSEWDRDRHIITTRSGAFEVSPETVGQYIGIEDKNNKIIYTGDIVKTKVVTYDETIREVVFQVVWNQSYVEYQFANKEFMYECVNFEQRDLEVVGNVFDNPELLR